MAAGLPIAKWFALFLLAGQSILSPVHPTSPVLSAKETLSSRETFTPIVRLTEGLAEQIRSELAYNRSA